jgi:competence protein ComEA
LLSERIRERLGGLERRELIGLLAIGAVVVAAVGFWYVRSLPTQVRIEAAGGAVRPAVASAGGAGGTVPVAGPSPSAATVVVDVAGWVHHPGVYDMRQGDRVIDALQAAGGAKPGANLTSINLAALLSDAQQILVTRLGAHGSGAGDGSAGAGAAGAPGTKININTATLDQLETLSGIGEVLGQRVIDYREQHGPFHSVDDLLNVSGIGPSHLADMKESVTV